MLRGNVANTAKCLTRQFHTQRPMSFQWQKLVTPFTSKAWVAEMQAFEKDLSVKQVAIGSLPTTVDPIDWEHWEKEIETEGVVAALKAEYENMNFPKPKSDGSEITAAREATMIAEAEADVRFANYELAAADKALALIHRVKNEGQTWTFEQWEAYIPGLSKDFDAKYEAEDFLPSKDSVKLHAMDFKEVRARIKAGDKTLMDELHVDDQVGDMSTKAEIEMIKKGEWSISRLFAGAEERAAIAAEVKRIRAGQ